MKTEIKNAVDTLLETNFIETICDKLILERRYLVYKEDIKQDLYLYMLENKDKLDKLPDGQLYFYLIKVLKNWLSSNYSDAYKNYIRHDDMIDSDAAPWLFENGTNPNNNKNNY